MQECYHTYKTIAKENNTELVMDFDDKIESYICSDQQIVRLILMNLIDNAIKSTKDGVVMLKAMIFKQQHIKIIIKDSGNGIDEEILNSLFDIFQL